VLIVVHAALAMAIYVIIVGPMNEDIEDLLSTHNEGLVLFFSSFVFLFSDFCTDPEAKVTFGLVYLILFGIALLNNIAVSGFLMFKMTKVAIRRALGKRRLHKHLSEKGYDA